MAEIVLDKVTKTFGETVALDNLTITIPDAAFVVLLGPTGAGKTTALRLISGLDNPDAGEILFDGEPVNGTTPAQRNVAMVFQQYFALSPSHRTSEPGVSPQIAIDGSGARGD